MSVDPSHFLPAANGGKPPLLKLQNISARPELNGKFGQAVSYSAGRYVVAILDASAAAATDDQQQQQPTFLKLKPENLAEAGNLDQLRIGAQMMYHTAISYLSSPAMQERGQNILSMLPPFLQQKMTPTRALIAAVIAIQFIFFFLLFVLGRILGFSKVIIFISLIGLLLAVSSPDWIEGYKANKPIQLIAKSSALNFRRRWKDHLVAMTGYTNISDTMALASLALLVVFAGKILLARTPSSSHMSMGDNTFQRIPHTISTKYDLEQIYKLGYDDAKAGSEFGTSFPKHMNNNHAEAVESHSVQDHYDDDKGYDWAYNPPPLPNPPRSKSNLGMGTLLSAFALYRFGKDVITSPNGQVVFDLQYIATRLRNIEPWRIGIMFVSLYRVVKALISFF